MSSREQTVATVAERLRALLGPDAQSGAVADAVNNLVLLQSHLSGYQQFITREAPPLPPNILDKAADRGIPPSVAQQLLDLLQTADESRTVTLADGEVAPKPRDTRGIPGMQGGFYTEPLSRVVAADGTLRDTLTWFTQGKQRWKRVAAGCTGKTRGGGLRQCTTACAGPQDRPLGNPTYWTQPLDAGCSESGAVAGGYVARRGQWDAVDMPLRRADGAYQEQFWGQ